MPVFTTTMTVQYAIGGDITIVDNNLIEWFAALAALNDTEDVRLQDVRWQELPSGLWQYRVRFQDGRVYKVEGAYPTAAPDKTHTVNTENHQFTDALLQALLVSQLAWIKLVVEHQISYDLHTFEYTP